MSIPISIYSLSDKQFLTISIYLRFIDNVVVCRCTRSSSSQVIGLTVNRFSSCKSCCFLTRSQLLNVLTIQNELLCRQSNIIIIDTYCLSWKSLYIQVKRILFSYYIIIIYNIHVYHHHLRVSFHAFFSFILFLYIRQLTIYLSYFYSSFCIFIIIQYTPKVMSIWWSINKLFDLLTSSAMKFLLFFFFGLAWLGDNFNWF